MRHGFAIGCWVLAWAFAGLVVAAFFAAAKGDARTARIELAAGVLGAAGLSLIGVALWQP